MAPKGGSGPGLIGLLLLTGVATKKSILIVDYAIIGERDQSLSRRDAIMAVCRKRARPVIMTTIAMGAGISTFTRCAWTGPIAWSTGARASGGCRRPPRRNPTRSSN